jgi:hypothetical protein
MMRAQKLSWLKRQQRHMQQPPIGLLCRDGFNGGAGGAQAPIPLVQPWIPSLSPSIFGKKEEERSKGGR